MKHIFMIAATCFCGLVVQAQQLPQLGKDSVKEIVAAMTLEEKISMVVGGGMPGLDFDDDGNVVPRPIIGNTDKMVPGAAGTTNAIPRLGVLPTVMADGPAGLRLRQSYQVDRETDSVYSTGVLGSLENGFLEPMKIHENADTYYLRRQHCQRKKHQF